jgi:inner membrane protein
MASIGHLAVGAAIGAIYSRTTGSNSRISILTFAGLALAPDLDLVTALFGVTDGTPLAHRGISHSIVFALVVAAMVGVYTRRHPRGGLRLAGFVLAAVVSHGLLDTLSQLGDGPMLLWPFSTLNYESVWRPIPGVLSASHYLTIQSIPTLAIETVMFLPLIVFALVSLYPRRVSNGAADATR